MQLNFHTTNLDLVLNSLKQEIRNNYTNKGTVFKNNFKNVSAIDHTCFLTPPSRADFLQYGST